MKEVKSKELPEVSGGEFAKDGCIPYPDLPGTEGGSKGHEPIIQIDNITPDA